MAAFDLLPAELQRALQERVDFRRERYLEMNRQRWKPAGTEVLLVGDRPAPDAPDDPQFHYTPFGALRHSSLWLNRLLEQHGIEEAELGWMNAYTFSGELADPRPLSYRWSSVIALGHSASKFLERSGIKHSHVMHPQAWKRFHSKESYPLIGLLAVNTP